MKKTATYVRRVLRWIMRAIVLGVAVGFAMWALSTCVLAMGTFREGHSFLLLFLPLAALLITWLYQILGPYLRSGIAQVIEMINQGLLAISMPNARKGDNEASFISVKMAPLLFFSTILSHFVGASTGKEGAGVQIGASIGSYLSKLEDLLLPKRLEEHDASNSGIWLISGAGAAFGALFHAPVAGTLFGLQFSSPNVNRTDAFIPCLVSSYVACAFSKEVLHIHTISPPLAEAVPLRITTFLYLALLSIAFGFACKLFLFLIRSWKRFLSWRFKGVYERTLCSSILLLALTYLFSLITGSFMLNGLSASLIGQTTQWYVPLLKMALTVVTIGSGFVGGEVIPIMVIGSTFASLFASLLSIPASALAMFGAIGMLSAATKLPLACFMLGLEIFGYANPAALFLVSIVSFSVSGISGIYEKQVKTMALEEKWEV